LPRLPNDSAMTARGARPVALVTGAGRRVGRALALALGEQGYDIAAHYHASRDGAEETESELARRGAHARLFAANLADAEAPSQVVRDVVAEMGRLDTVVNSAAVMIRTPMGEITSRQWDDIL